MTDPFYDLELKLTPDWLKESSTNPYENYAGEDRRERSREPRRFNDRGPRRDSRDSRNPRNPRDSKSAPANRHPRDPRDSNRPPFSKKPSANREPAQQQPSPAPIDFIKVEFLPNANGAANLAKQIKSSHRAYPLFQLARMFLEKPERYDLRLTSSDENTPFYRVGDLVTLDKANAERLAFSALKHDYYAKEDTKIEPPKGNYTSVARCTLNGAILGPTNYHAYQLNLRWLYEDRFSRRMSFPEFQRSIENVTDPAAIESWKEKASTFTIFKTLKEEQPLTFRSSQEAEAHFREHYLAAAIQSSAQVEVSGTALRNHPDRRIMRAVREAWDKEKVFPSRLAHELCTHFNAAGLHTFKHRKRFLFVSVVRPIRFPAESGARSAVTEILRLIEAHPRCTRTDLGAKMLAEEAAEQHEQHKTELAADLHYLIHSGHVIEFHDGKLDLPLAPKEMAAGDAANHQVGENSKPEKSPEPIAAASDKATEAQAIGELEVAKEENNDIVPEVETVETSQPEIAVSDASDSHETTAPTSESESPRENA